MGGVPGMLLITSNYTADGRSREYGLLLFVMSVAFLFSTVVSFL